MPTKEPQIPKTDVAKLIVKWWRSQPGVLSMADLARIVGLKYASLSYLLFESNDPQIETLIQVATRTREYNELKPPDFSDPSYPFVGPGIPLDQLLAAKDPALAEVFDAWEYIAEAIRNADKYPPDVQRQLIADLMTWRNRFVHGLPPRDRPSERHVG